MSIEEVEFLWNCDALAAAEKLLGEFGAKLVFITLGAEGCYFENPTCRGTACYGGDLKVVDTTGAGDIFGGSAVWMLLKLGISPEELNEEQLTEMVTFACTAAGLSTTRPGGISSVPTLEEVRAVSL